MSKPMQLTLSLSDEPFFRDMDPEVVTDIEAYVYQREYEARQIIYFPDDTCDYVYWVREGRVKVMRVSGDGRELTYRHLLAGEMLGEECLGEESKRNDYAEAMTNTVLYLMRVDDFRRVLRDEIEFANHIAQHFCKRARETEGVLADTVFKTVRSRVAAVLFRLSQHEQSNNPEEIAIRVTHQEVANLAGSTRETTTSVLHGLREEGILNMANRRLTVLDIIALENLARSG